MVGNLEIGFPYRKQRRSRKSRLAHLFSCKKLSAATRIDTHNSITHTIKAATDRLNLFSCLETRHFADTNDKRDSKTDIEIFFPHQLNLEVDVHIVCPIAPSYISRVACKGTECTHRAPCGSDEVLLKSKEQAKRRKHATRVKKKGARFQPFVLSTFGAFSGSSYDVINDLAGYAAKNFPLQWETPGEWAKHFKTQIAFQIHRETHAWWNMLYAC